MVVNNLIVNNKLKLLNNSSLKSSENLNGTAESTLNDDSNNKISKLDIVVPSKQYENLKNVNIILDKRNNMINSINDDAIGKFIISNPSNHVIYYSEDGTTWNYSILPDTYSYMCYGDDKFVTIGNRSSTIYYSADGINWNKSSILTSNWESIQYLNNKFIAYDSSGYVGTSVDGIQWSSTIKQVNDGAIKYIINYNDKFIGVYEGATTINLYDSDDGIEYKFYIELANNTNGSRHIRFIYNYNGKIIVITNNLIIYSSSDNIRYTKTTISNMDFNVTNGCVYKNMIILAGIRKYGSNRYCSLLFINIDTLTLEKFIDLPDSDSYTYYPVYICQGNNILIVTIYNTRYVYTSIDGSNWNLNKTALINNSYTTQVFFIK